MQRYGRSIHPLLFTQFPAFQHIMGYYVRCQTIESIRITKNSPHLCHCPLTLFNLILRSTLFSTAVIIFLAFVCLFIRKDNTGNAKFVCNTNSNTLITELLHGVTIDLIIGVNRMLNFWNSSTRSSCSLLSCSGIMSATISVSSFKISAPC